MDQELNILEEGVAEMIHQHRKMDNAIREMEYAVLDMDYTINKLQKQIQNLRVKDFDMLEGSDE